MSIKSVDLSKAAQKKERSALIVPLGCKSIEHSSDSAKHAGAWTL